MHDEPIRGTINNHIRQGSTRSVGENDQKEASSLLLANDNASDDIEANS